jgi:hypothetical protein
MYKPKENIFVFINVMRDQKRKIEWDTLLNIGCDLIAIQVFHGVNLA